MRHFAKGWSATLLDESTLKTLLHLPDLDRKVKLLMVLVTRERPMSVSEVRSVASKAGLRSAKDWNISDILASSNGLAIRVQQGWEITPCGLERVLEAAGQHIHTPIIRKSAQSLRSKLDKILDEQTRNFVDEAIRCFEIKAFRAAVVLTWVGAVSVLQSYVVKNCLAQFNAEALRRNPKWKLAQNADQLGRMQESEFLDVLEAIAVLGNNVKQELQNLCLKLRNGCGHPNSMLVEEHRVASHIEMLALNVFARFS